MLTQKTLMELLSYDPATGCFVWNSARRNSVAAGDVAGSATWNGYVGIKINGKRYLAHRLAWLYVHGVWTENQLDHINRIRNDNRLENIREVTNQQNHFNVTTQSNNTSGHTGVSWSAQHKKWQAYIMVNQKQNHLGHFASLEEAAEAYQKAKAVLHVI